MIHGILSHNSVQQGERFRRTHVFYRISEMNRPFAPSRKLYFEVVFVHHSERTGRILKKKGCVKLKGTHLKAIHPYARSTALNL